MSYPHFEGKDPLEHVKKKRNETLTLRYEPHGLELSGSSASLIDAARESALVLLLVATLLFSLSLSPKALILYFTLTSFSFALWKLGKSMWLGWFRLERFHRVIEQEKFEIEHHRPQEREELVALYEAKGLSGDLLERVVDGLMADQDHLLKVMLEEELGLILEAYEHPLKQGFGAFLGSILTAILLLLFLFFFSLTGVVIAAMGVLALSAFFAARREGNRYVPAIIWSMALALLSFFTLKFLIDWMNKV